jgi:hypothetical protein
MYTRSTRPLLVIAAILASSAAALAQIVVGEPAGVITCTGFVTPPPIYTATWEITTVQNVKGHLVTTHVRTEKRAYDSVGRSFHETHSTAWRNGRPGSLDIVLGDIHDPMRGVMITWSSGSTEAAVFHAPNPQPPREKPARLPDVDCSQQQPPPPPPPPDPAVRHLGPKTIHGMEATGIRFPLVIPAQPGSNKPAVKATQESWTARDGGLEVLRIVKYPNGDYEKSELVSFEDDAPDPALFDVPEGYTVRDVYQDARPASF